MSLRHTCEYNQLPNRSNHFDTPLLQWGDCIGKYVTLTVNMSEGTGVNLRIWMNEKKEGRWPS